MRHPYEKGTTVKPTEQIAKSASTPKSGLFVRLCGLLRVGGSGAPSRRRFLAGLSTLCVLAGGLLFTSAPAYAYRTYGVSGTLGSEGSGDGQLMSPRGVALNESTEPLLDSEAGDVYVADTGNSRVQWFALNPATKKYEYAGQFNGEQTPAKSLNVIGGIAIDNSTEPLDPFTGDVYVASGPGSEPAVVDKFSATGAYQGQLTGTCENKGETAVEPGACPDSASKEIIPFFRGQVQGVAVDPEGHLFVLAALPSEGAQEAKLDEFNSDGTFLGTFIFRAFSKMAGIAVDSSGDIYAQTEGSTKSLPAVVGKFDSTTGATKGELGDGHEATSLAVDPANNHVFVDTGSGIQEYGAFGEPYSEPLLTFPNDETSSVLSGSEGVAVSQAGTVFASQSGADDVEVLNEVFPPSVEAAVVSGNAGTSVTLNGNVNPEGRPLTSCEFEYGTSSSYGHVAACEEPNAAEVGEGSSSVPVHVNISGLAYDTTYHYRLLAGNATAGSETKDQEFTTRGPRVFGEGLTNVGLTYATLQASINPNGSPTSYHFEYDTTPYTTSAPHGTSLPVPNASIGEGTSVVPASVTLPGLKPGSVYYYRVVVESRIAGKPATFDGPGDAFTTSSLPSAASPENCPNAQLRAEQPYGLGLPDCRAYEMVSPLNKEDNSISFAAARASVSGEALTYVSQGSFAEPTGEEPVSRYIARREPGEDGWSTRNITPPVNTEHTNIETPFEELIFTPTLSEGLVKSHYIPLAPGEPAGYFDLDLANFMSTPTSYRAVSFPPPDQKPFAQSEEEAGLRGVGASTDLSHIVIEGPVGGGEEWAAGVLRPVTLLPPAAVEADGPSHIGAAGPGLDHWRAVSENGQRVFFTVGTGQSGGRSDSEAALGQVYVRENAGQPPSSATPHAEGTANLTSGAASVTSLVAAAGTGTLHALSGSGTLTSGSPIVSSLVSASGTGTLSAAGGTGTLTTGSKEVTALTTSSGAFAAGQRISGTGIPAGATITAVGSGSLTLSAEAVASGTAVVLTAGSTEVTSLATTGGEFVVGQPVSGTGIPAGATITAVSGATIILSVPVTAAGAGVQISSEGPAPFAVGQSISAPGIPGGTTIIAVGPGTLTLSASATASSGAVALSSFSPEVTSLVTTSGEFVVGQPVSGTGIPAGATVTKVSGTTLTLSVPVTAAGTGVAMSSDGPAPFAVGQEIAGDGIPFGTTITAAGPGTLTLSAPSAISGSAVTLRAGGECTVSADACTIEVSGSQRTIRDPNGVKPARYWGASADGSKVFFTSRAELTNNANTGPEDNAANLYEYNVETKELTDLTVPAQAEEMKGEDPDGAAVLGMVTAGAEGSYVYFVAEGKLAEGATLGQPNLYLSHAGETKFIATLAPATDREEAGGEPGGKEEKGGDSPDWAGAREAGEGRGFFGGPGSHTARVTPDGTALAFESERSLTGYDNEQAEPGECEASQSRADEAEAHGLRAAEETGECREIYLYNETTGKLVCASCNPLGVRPIGPSNLGGEEGDASFAVPDNYEGYLPRNLSEDGERLFFQSRDALVPHASDGKLNVYEWEAEGEGTCTQAGGCILPISDVAGDYGSHFMDASTNGSDVFIATIDQLVPSDTDSRQDVYDVHVDGGFPVTVASPVCNNGDSCKPPASPQPAIFGAPSSATFSGPGNPAPAIAPPQPKETTTKTVKCKKGFAKKKDKCVKDKKKSKKAKKAKKSNRRAH